MGSDRVVLRSQDGREADLGQSSSFHAVAGEIRAYIGGSSGFGRWSYLWGHVVAGFPSDEPVAPDLFDAIADAAADFQAAVGADLSEEANELLIRLAGEGDQPAS